MVQRTTHTAIVRGHASRFFVIVIMLNPDFSQDQLISIVYTTLFSSAASSSYILVIYYARRTIQELDMQSSYMSERTMALQKQVGKALFGQVSWF